jgi:hypothetical protein
LPSCDWPLRTVHIFILEVESTFEELYSEHE